jgi:Spy/CpxP family protein refolding chaperone
MKKQTKMKSTISLMLGALLFSGIAITSTDAEARRGRKGHGGKMGGHGLMLSGGIPSGMKEKLQLTDVQIRRIDAIRMNFQNKRIDLKARLSRLRLKSQQLMQQDQPPQDKVLQMMRQRRHLRGLLAEERVKAQLKIRATLTPKQRQQLLQLKAKRGFGNKRFHNQRGWRHDKFSGSTSAPKGQQSKNVKRINPVKRYAAKSRFQSSL